MQSWVWYQAPINQARLCVVVVLTYAVTCAIFPDTSIWNALNNLCVPLCFAFTMSVCDTCVLKDSFVSIKLLYIYKKKGCYF